MLIIVSYITGHIYVIVSGNVHGGNRYVKRYN